MKAGEVRRAEARVHPERVPELALCVAHEAELVARDGREVADDGECAGEDGEAVAAGNAAIERVEEKQARCWAPRGAGRVARRGGGAEEVRV